MTASLLTHRFRSIAFALSLAALAGSQSATAVTLNFIDNAPSVASGNWSPVVDPLNPSAGLYVLNTGNSYQRYDASGYLITGFPHGDVAGVAWGVGNKYNGFVNPSVDGSLSSVDFTITSRKGSFDGVANAFLLMQNNKYYRTAFNIQAPGTSTPEELFTGSGLTAASFGEFVGAAYDYSTPANGSANFGSNPDFSASGGTITFGYLSHFDASLGSGFAGGVAYQMTKNWSAAFNFGAVAVGWAINGSGDWNVNANWTSGIPNGVDAVANFGSAINTPQTIYTNIAVTVGTLRFDNASSYQVTGQGTLNIDVSSGSGSIEVTQGNHKINLPLVIKDNTTAAIAAGATLKISDPMTLMGGSTLTKSGAGTLTIEAPVTNAALATLAVNAGVVNSLTDLGANTALSVSGGTVNLRASQHLSNLNVSGGKVIVGPGTSVVASTAALSVSGSGQIDLQNSKIVVDYDGISPVDAVQTAINAGSITSSMLTPDRAIGFGEATDIFGSFPASFSGQEIDADSILVAFTVMGDASLDGTVDSNDFNLLSAYYGQTNGSRWTQGDLDGNGKVNTLDFNLLAGHFGQSLPATSTLGATVPEPAAVSLLMLGAAPLLRRRHRA